MNNNNLIFHYTSISGLIGIISSHQLWASDCRYLNDGTELSYANEIFFSELEKLNLAPIEGRDGGYVIPSGALDYFRMFITCFCEKGDLLSQWRGYGIDQGYSLGFNRNKLMTIEEVDNVVPVKYGIDNPEDYFQDELKSANHISAHPSNSQYFASQWFLPRLARVKHPGFREEK